MSYRRIRIPRKLYDELEFLGQWASPSRTVSEQIKYLLENFEDKENRNCGRDPLTTDVTLDEPERIDIDKLIAAGNRSDALQ
ncbi:MAG: hypothetical protein IJA14_03860 [Alphaproteobacteria bacterium]|nr:hypothetical protein [Alphaproteobacteria bacterium]